MNIALLLSIVSVLVCCVFELARVLLWTMLAHPEKFC